MLNLIPGMRYIGVPFVKGGYLPEKIFTIPGSFTTDQAGYLAEARVGDNSSLLLVDNVYDTIWIWDNKLWGQIAQGEKAKLLQQEIQSLIHNYRREWEGEN